MNVKKRNLLTNVGCALTLLFAGFLASADPFPAENPSETLLRTETSGYQLDAQLSKNVFRTVSHTEVKEVQVPYTVRVPYQVVETYYVNVKVCHQESHPVNVCHQERICHRFPSNHCEVVKVCHVEQRVENVCHNEKQARTRVVTRYRDEIRYRLELRTVVVTEQIYDHQWGTAVTVLFPESAPLFDGATEQVVVRLAGSESNPDVLLDVNSSIYIYTIGSKVHDQYGIVITLEKNEKSKFDDLSLAYLRVSSAGKKNEDSVIEFTDTAPTDLAWETVYQIRVTAKKKTLFGRVKTVVLAEGKFNRTSNQVNQMIEFSKFDGLSKASMRRYLAAGRSVTVELVALRSNPNLIGKVLKSELTKTVVIESASN